MIIQNRNGNASILVELERRAVAECVPGKKIKLDMFVYLYSIVNYFVYIL